MALAGCRQLVRSLVAGRCAQASAAVTLFRPALRCMSSQSSSLQPSYVPKTSLSEPPWPRIKLPDPIEEAEEHRGFLTSRPARLSEILQQDLAPQTKQNSGNTALQILQGRAGRAGRGKLGKQLIELVTKVNNLIATGQFGRLFAVIHFASKQWKVTNEDLVLINGSVDAECGDRIRLEKVLLVGSDNFTLVGKPLLGKDLVRVEATVIEKTESHPKINMKFWKRHRYQKKKIIIDPQTVLRINTIEIVPALS